MTCARGELLPVFRSHRLAIRTAFRICDGRRLFVPRVSRVRIRGRLVVGCRRRKAVASAKVRRAGRSLRRKCGRRRPGRTLPHFSGTRMSQVASGRLSRRYRENAFATRRGSLRRAFRGQHGGFRMSRDAEPAPSAMARALLEVHADAATSKNGHAIVGRRCPNQGGEGVDWQRPA